MVPRDSWLLWIPEWVGSFEGVRSFPAKEMRVGRFASHGSLQVASSGHNTWQRWADMSHGLQSSASIQPHPWQFAVQGSLDTSYDEEFEVRSWGKSNLMLSKADLLSMNDFAQFLNLLLGFPSQHLLILIVRRLHVVHFVLVMSVSEPGEWQISINRCWIRGIEMRTICFNALNCLE